MKQRLEPSLFRLVREICESIGTPLSLGVFLRVKYGVWEQLPTSVMPSHYLDTVSGASKFARDLQSIDLLRKCEGLSIGVDTRKSALDALLQQEKVNYLTNVRLSYHLMGYQNPSLDPVSFERINQFLAGVRNHIRLVCGPLPDFLEGRFSNGTNVGLQYDTSTKCHKIQKPTMTEGAKYLAQWLMPHAWERALLESKSSMSSFLVKSEKFGTVPKNFKTDRTIGVQPVWNLYLQLGIGSHLRHRLLRKANIDLKHGQSTHMRIASVGSRNGDIATIDLKNASNSVSRKVIELLFPREWFELLDTVRCPSIDIDGETHRLEMFSAMGNGFTFELQTILYWAVCRQCGVSEPLVYGDDIIVPTEYAIDVCSALKYLGFAINESKTFVDGPFRESCGGNSFLGWDVTPFRLTKLPTEPSDWISIHNGLSLRIPYAWRARLTALAQIPFAIRRCVGPRLLGDIVLHTPDWRQGTVPERHIPRVLTWTRTKLSGRRIPLVLGRGTGMTFCYAYLPIGIKIPFDRVGGAGHQMALALAGESSDGLSTRGTSGYRLGVVPCS